MKIVSLTLSIVDVLIGLAVLFSVQTLFGGIFMLGKGLYSLTFSLSKRYFFDWMGWIDLIAGLILILNISLAWFGIIVIIKGAYSLVWSLG